MNRIRRIAHAAFETADLEKQVEYYEQVLGLTLAGKADGRAYLANRLDHHSVVLESGSEARCTRLGFCVAEGELEDMAKQVEAAGVKVERASDAQPGVPVQISFEDPKGTRLEVFEPDASSVHPFSGRGVSPLKLGHVAFNTTEIRKVVDFYRDVLGFRESDWMGDFFAFIRCGPDHHTVNFVSSEKIKMHHVAFELRDMAHVQRACDYLAQKDIPLIWGPGRHGMGHNIYTYHRNPEGQIVELFTELDQMKDEELGHWDPRPWHTEFPAKPKVWPPGPASANLWGVGPPDGFLD